MKLRKEHFPWATPVICVIFLIVMIEGNLSVLKRSKRFIWMSKDRRFILPPGSTLIITPKLQIPFIRQPPEGLNSDIQISWPFYMFFDKLGMTGESHPWPPFFPFGDLFSITRRNSTIIKDPDEPNKKDKVTLSTKLNSHKHVRPKRAILSLPPPDSIHGGERAIILPRIEKILNGIGMEGRSCLLRAICEVHEYPLHEGYGLFGEILTLLFSISSSSYAESHLPEYLKAENQGKAGECFSYFKKCKKSMFTWEEKNKYSEEMQLVRHSHLNSHHDDDDLNIDNDLESYRI